MPLIFAMIFASCGRPLFSAANPRYLSLWDLGARWLLLVTTYIPGVALERSDPSGIKSGWDQGAERQQGAKMCVRVLTNEIRKYTVST